MKHKAALQWAATRKMGRNKYITRYGLVGFGLGIALLLTLFEYLSIQQITPKWVLVRCLIFPIVGFFIFSTRWEKQETQFAEDQQVQPKL